jgi:hypothetical protein
MRHSVKAEPGASAVRSGAEARTTILENSEAASLRGFPYGSLRVYVVDAD